MSQSSNRPHRSDLHHNSGPSERKAIHQCLRRWPNSSLGLYYRGNCSNIERSQRTGHCLACPQENIILRQRGQDSSSLGHRVWRMHQDFWRKRFRSLPNSVLQGNGWGFRLRLREGVLERVFDPWLVKISSRLAMLSSHRVILYDLACSLE